MKEWIETDAVNVLAHALENQPCISERNYESTDPAMCGKVIGLPGIVRPCYPDLPLDVNLSAGQDEQIKTQAETKGSIETEPTNTTSPTIPDVASTVLQSKLLKVRHHEEVAIYGSKNKVDIAREKDLVQQDKKTSTSLDPTMTKKDVTKLTITPTSKMRSDTVACGTMLSIVI